MKGGDAVHVCIYGAVQVLERLLIRSQLPEKKNGENGERTMVLLFSVNDLKLAKRAK